MKETAGTMRTCRKAKVTPTASASMLVAMASRIILPGATEQSTHSSSLFRDSRIMLNPMMPRRIKAIQWSMEVMASLN